MLKYYRIVIYEIQKGGIPHMKKYEQPAIELIKFEMMDVLVASGLPVVSDPEDGWNTPVTPATGL